VLTAVGEQYRTYQANIHRGVHYLSEQSTVRVERVRQQVADFLHAEAPEEIIFTSGSTESINIIARAFADGFLQPGDRMLVTEMEHHSNLVPWQEACRRAGAELLVVPVTDAGELDLEELLRLLDAGARLLAVTWVSNVLGTVNPLAQIIRMAHAVGCPVLVDAAQAMRHGAVDVRSLNCDFLCFSGHKMMAPTGVGVLYGKRRRLERLPPVSFGGGMIDEVDTQRATWAELPFKFEAGTPNIAGIIGLGAALEYLQSLGLPAIYEREADLAAYAEARLRERDDLDILGAPGRRAGAVSFNLRGLSYYDVAKLLDQLGVAARSGHHCAQPLLTRFGLTGAVRVTPAFYNTREEIDALMDGLDRIAALSQRSL
jgi:cysteine desulfurase/selenocysteine lyase